MFHAAFFYDHRHDCILVGLPALLVRAHDLVYPDVAHEVARDEDEVGGDDPMRVDVAHSIPRGEGLLRRDDGHNLQA